jgi:superfamily II DNA or RNA helicase
MYQEQQRRGFSTWRIPRWIFALRRTKESVEVPAGFLRELDVFANENNLQLTADDQRAICKAIMFKTTLQLSDEQKKVASMLLKHDRAILEAKPGFGKTMVALYCMKRRKQPTLIIVHTKALLQQWKKRIEEWFDLKKDDLGIIGDSKWKIGKKVTVASYKTLMSRGMEEIKDQFGLVIVDECHHVPAKTFTEVVSTLPAKYVLGLTATAYRRDKLHLLLPLYIGLVVKTDSMPEIKEKASVRTVLRIRQTSFETKQKGGMDFHLLMDELTKDAHRNQNIVDDLVIALHSGAKCLVLTERVEHCEVLLDLARKNIKGIHADVARGYMTKKARERLSQRIKQDRFQLLIATGKLIGEGYDWPECTHLFLVCPLSYKGKLVQYVGRVQRETEGKETAYVFDYADMAVPMLKGMYFKRLRTYRAMGIVREGGKSKSSQKPPEDQLSMF